MAAIGPPDYHLRSPIQPGNGHQHQQTGAAYRLQPRRYASPVHAVIPQNIHAPRRRLVRHGYLAGRQSDIGKIH